MGEGLVRLSGAVVYLLAAPVDDNKCPYLRPLVWTVTI